MLVGSLAYSLFQSTPPRGGRPGGDIEHELADRVSIHAPARGATGRGHSQRRRGLKDTAYIVGVILAVIVASGIAFVYLTSRYRKAADAEKDKYIAALEARNTFLEEERDRFIKEQEQTKRRLHNLEGKVCMLQDLVLRQCRCAEIDATTGGCRFCAKGMAYGQGGA